MYTLLLALASKRIEKKFDYESRCINTKYVFLIENENVHYVHVVVTMPDNIFITTDHRLQYIIHGQI